jgi:hypothetical protein
MKKILILTLLVIISITISGQIRQVLKQNKFSSASFKQYEVEIKKKWFDTIEFRAMLNLLMQGQIRVNLVL